jgi:23S rRNA (adenine2503-C2)-methyltransferase
LSDAATPRNLHGTGSEELAALMVELGVEPYRGRQIFRAIHGEGASRFEEITTLPAALRDRLAGSFVIDRPEVASRSESGDGTVKFLLDLPGGSRVEAVAIPDRGRWTFCLSSQVGCALGCTFCMTARLGLERNLSAGEIVGQLELLCREVGAEPRLSRIVLMGMGEPLHNYEAVLAAVRILGDPQGAGLSPRRITLSTVGLVPEIRRLAGEPDPPRLAVSLNATTDEIRAELMPVARRYPLAELLEAARHFAAGHRDRVTFEYVLLAGVNDSDADARRLVRLVHGVRAKVNLIPFNPTSSLPYERPSDGRVRAFRDLLLARGVPASVRRSRGRDVEGACGQLAFSELATGSGAGESR